MSSRNLRSSSLKRSTSATALRLSPSKRARTEPTSISLGTDKQWIEKQLRPVITTLARLTPEPDVLEAWTHDMKAVLDFFLKLSPSASQCPVSPKKTDHPSVHSPVGLESTPSRSSLPKSSPDPVPHAGSPAPDIQQTAASQSQATSSTNERVQESTMTSDRAVMNLSASAAPIAIAEQQECSPQQLLQQMGLPGSNFRLSIEKTQGLSRRAQPLVASADVWYDILVEAYESLEVFESARSAAKLSQSQRRRNRRSDDTNSSSSTVDPPDDPAQHERVKCRQIHLLADRVIYIARIFGMEGLGELQRLLHVVCDQGSHPTILSTSIPANLSVSGLWQKVDEVYRESIRTHAGSERLRYQLYRQRALFWRMIQELITLYEDPNSALHHEMVTAGYVTAPGKDPRSLVISYYLMMQQGLRNEDICPGTKDIQQLDSNVRSQREGLCRSLTSGKLYNMWESTFGVGSFVLLSDKDFSIFRRWNIEHYSHVLKATVKILPKCKQLAELLHARVLQPFESGQSLKALHIGAPANDSGSPFQELTEYIKEIDDSIPLVNDES